MAGGWEQGWAEAGSLVRDCLSHPDRELARPLGVTGEPEKGTALGYALEAELMELVDRLGVGGDKENRTQR